MPDDPQDPSPDTASQEGGVCTTDDTLASGDGDATSPESSGAETSSNGDGAETGGVCTTSGDDAAASGDGTSTTGDTTDATSTSAAAAVMEVKLRVFIPCRALQAVSFTGRRAFAGDDRGFSYDAGTSRAELVGSLTIGGGASISDRKFGMSEEYRYDDVVSVPGKPSWFMTLKQGFTVIDSGTQTATDDHLNFVGGAAGDSGQAAFSSSEGTTVGKLTVDGQLPLMTGAPAIDADLFVHVRVSGGRLQAVVRGAHDGFPAYEIYVDQQLIYSYDPVAAGATPAALLPPEDVKPTMAFVDVGAAP